MGTQLMRPETTGAIPGAGEPEPAERRLQAALLDLERSIEEVRQAACALASRRGQCAPSLRLLGIVQQATRQVREACLDAGTAPPAPPTGPGPVTWAQAVERTRLAEDALWEVRKSLRKDPPAAVERLAALALEGVDARVAEQVYGEWLRQCFRLGLPGALKYDAGFGRGAVLVPDAPGWLRVVSALGLPGWAPGLVVERGTLDGLRRLR